MIMLFGISFYRSEVHKLAFLSLDFKVIKFESTDWLQTDCSISGCG